MDKEMGIVAILAICVVVLVIGMLKQKAEALLNFTVRVLVGGAALYVTNGLIAAYGSSITVGMNPGSLAVIGILGASGFGLLYGIMIYQSL